MTERPFLIFYGTSTALVFAASESKAFVAFIEQAFPSHQTHGKDSRHWGHYARPVRDEVNIRPRRADDAGGIEAFHGRGAAPFIKALGKVGA